jgi:hypothetical protein
MFEMKGIDPRGLEIILVFTFTVELVLLVDLKTQ